MSIHLYNTYIEGDEGKKIKEEDKGRKTKEGRKMK
jgi:hypothetical protein